MASWLVRRRGEITTTGRTLTISGALKPVEKSQVTMAPGPGWKVSANLPAAPVAAARPRERHAEHHGHQHGILAEREVA
ncbi:MAG: hypothetical protein ACRYG8_14950, partial [Janthinobacterium lividum]